MRRLAVMTVLVALGTAACGGGGGDGDGIATLSDDAGGDETTTTTIDPEEAMLAFAECMRDNGADFPDPAADGAIELRIDRADEEAWREAEEACADLRPKMAPLSEAERAEVEEQARAMAECLRDRGWDMPDPIIRTPGDGGVQVMQEAPEDFTFDDPEFQADQEACSEEVGMEGGPMTRASRAG